jgi:hypothetical protein
VGGLEGGSLWDGEPADVLPTRLMAVIVFVLVQMLCAVIRWGFMVMI